MDGSYMLAEKVNTKLKIQVCQTVLSAKEKNQAGKKGRKCQQGEGLEL